MTITIDTENLFTNMKSENNLYGMWFMLILNNVSHIVHTNKYITILLA